MNNRKRSSRIKHLLVLLALFLLWPKFALCFDPGQFRGATLSQRCQEYSKAWTPNWSSLLGYWPMNCAVGTNASSTKYGDFSSNSRHLTSQTTLTCEAGVNEQALKFNGSDQYAIVSYAEALHPTAEVTVSAWVNFTSLTASDEVMLISTFQTGGYGLELDGSGNIAFAVRVSGAYYYVRSSTSNLSVNTWYHLVGTYDGSTLKIYINSVLAGSTTQSGTIAYTSNSPVCMGQDATGSGCDSTRPYFSGSLDDVAIWSTALTQAQIQSLYLRPNCDQLIIPQQAANVGLWHLNESLPVTAASSYADSSTKANHLTPNGTIYGEMGKFGFAPVTTSNTTYLYKDSPTGLPTSGNKTIAIWFKFTSTTACKTALCNFAGYGNPSVDGANFQVGTNLDGTFMVWGWGGGTWDWQTGVSSLPFFDSAWHHVAVTYVAGSPNTTNIYLDGVLKATTTAYTYSPTPNYIVLGNEIDKDGQSFSGALAEFGIWSTALSASEILALYQKTLPIRN